MAGCLLVVVVEGAAVVVVAVIVPDVLVALDELVLLGVVIVPEVLPVDVLAVEVVVLGMIVVVEPVAAVGTAGVLAVAVAAGAGPRLPRSGTQHPGHLPLYERSLLPQHVYSGGGCRTLSIGLYSRTGDNGTAPAFWDGSGQIYWPVFQSPNRGSYLRPRGKNRRSHCRVFHVCIRPPSCCYLPFAVGIWLVTVVTMSQCKHLKGT